MKRVQYDIAAPYTAVYVIFRQEGKVAFLMREKTNWMRHYYGLPAGRVEHNESLAAAAIRESKEEVGVDIKPEDLHLMLTGHRRHPDSLWVDAVFEARDWAGDLSNAEPDVHSELVWLDPKNLPQNTVPYVKNYVEAVERSDNYAEEGWED